MAESAFGCLPALTFRPRKMYLQLQPRPLKRHFVSICPSPPGCSWTAAVGSGPDCPDRQRPSTSLIPSLRHCCTTETPTAAPQCGLSPFVPTALLCYFPLTTLVPSACGRCPTCRPARSVRRYTLLPLTLFMLTMADPTRALCSGIRMGWVCTWALVGVQPM